MAITENRILTKLLDRLFASLINGPSLNCRPHSSRQRVDLLQLAKLGDKTPEEILAALLGPDREIKITAKVPAVKLPTSSKTLAVETAPEEDDEDLAPEQRAAQQAYRDQQTVLGKLRTIAEDARTYENDTGAHVLQIGFPLLSLPPGSSGGFGVTRRILAPLAFISLSMTVKAGPTPTVVLECRNEGADLVVPNQALLSWLQQQSGKEVGELFSDETGEKPWAEIVSIAQRVCDLVQVELPRNFGGEGLPEEFRLAAAPRSDTDEVPRPVVIPSAVVGLYPMANQGLLRDMQALVAGEPATGLIQSFVSLGASLEPTSTTEADAEPIERRTRTFTDERLVSMADPCQARAVRLARTSSGLVIHGPPGTGKSQTIANVIGDHLARGERVLFVCEKRTALDVVLNRLSGMGLGALCGIVHDPQRDQRELYKSIREQLDALTELRTDASADGTLARIDGELQRIHSELTEYHRALMVRPHQDGLSFHELIGRWLSSSASSADLDPKLLDRADYGLVEDHAQAISDLADRAARVDFPDNPWASAAGSTLEEYLAKPVEELRRAMHEVVAAAGTLDETRDPAIPPLAKDGDFAAVASSRARVAGELEAALGSTDAALRSRWSTADAGRIGQAHQQLSEVIRLSAELDTPLDGELRAIVADGVPRVAELAQQTVALQAYIASTKSFLGFLAFGKKSTATKVLAGYGQQLSLEAAVRVEKFLNLLRARLLARNALAQLAPEEALAALPDDEILRRAVQSHEVVLHFLKALHADPHAHDVAPRVQQALGQGDGAPDLIRGLRATAERVRALEGLSARLSNGLFHPGARQKLLAAGFAGQALLPTLKQLHDRFDSLENVLRVRHGMEALPSSLRDAVQHLVKQNVSGEVAVAALRKASDGNEIARRLKTEKLLTLTDGQKLKGSFSRYQQLETQKRQLTRDAILHVWGKRQRERLLALTGSRLNSLGADLRRRLTTRGERAMRLRQVITVGQAIEGGDPLYDLRPVWMASPETVAQLFPRAPLFDVVIFDEASQCKLEEALPVLLRAKRVVIAGDPKQLPPTRFFESAVAASEDEEIETDQQLFESQQGEIEDLLAAALNIEIDECYLDVHYRSRNADLIQFSNSNFYSSRLQAIPGHPSNRTRYAPLTMYKVGGVYEKRANVTEAERVCQIVRDLLKRAEPPSIGIACFNVTQRDLILEKLELLAASDSEFGKAYAEARQRRRCGAFEGLFVKNLENVQGDERDHMIISTTYGPDAKGRFYRRFGPVGSAGGGRRLNVLVTRARDEVHLVTSIPEGIYRNLPPVPAGESPGGAWLLFAYLVYAEQLAEVYEQNHRLLEQAQAAHEPIVNVRPSRFPSNFARQLAHQLYDNHRVGSDVHWGNDGFCVDLALHHPQRAEDVTIGVLCDLNRFEQASDPVEWEVFRTSVLESQGWTFNRIWTPHYFRDARSLIQGVLSDASTSTTATRESGPS